jgi:hypothetical protein
MHLQQLCITHKLWCASSYSMSVRWCCVQPMAACLACRVDCWCNNVTERCSHDEVLQDASRMQTMRSSVSQQHKMSKVRQASNTGPANFAGAQHRLAATVTLVSHDASCVNPWHGADHLPIRWFTMRPVLAKPSQPVSTCFRHWGQMQVRQDTAPARYRPIH